jgi:hypothetical protein
VESLGFPESQSGVEKTLPEWERKGNVETEIGKHRRAHEGATHLCAVGDELVGTAPLTYRSTYVDLCYAHVGSDPVGTQ